MDALRDRCRAVTAAQSADKLSVSVRTVFSLLQRILQSMTRRSRGTPQKHGPLSAAEKFSPVLTNGYGVLRES